MLYSQEKMLNIKESFFVLLTLFHQPTSWSFRPPSCVEGSTRARWLSRCKIRRLCRLKILITDEQMLVKASLTQTL